MLAIVKYRFVSKSQWNSVLCSREILLKRPRIVTWTFSQTFLELEQAQAQLGYLRRKNNIFNDNETRGKRLKCWQTSARSCLQLVNYYSDAQVYETSRMCEMFWCLLSQFLCDKSERNSKYLDICFAISSTNWKQNNSVARATFFASRCLDFERYAKMRRHAQYTNHWAIVFCKPAIRMCILKNSEKQEVNWQDTDRGVLLWLPACMCMLIANGTFCRRKSRWRWMPS